MKSDKELADELDAQKRLREHGYTEKRCTSCDGTGVRVWGRGPQTCYTCNGKGWVWEAPLMRCTDPHIALLRKSYPEQFPNG